MQRVPLLFYSDLFSSGKCNEYKNDYAKINEKNYIENKTLVSTVNVEAELKVSRPRKDDACIEK